MDILAPWSLASYVPLNGFRPLYRSLASVRAPVLRIFTPKRPGFDQLRSLMACDDFHNRNDPPFPDWVSCLDSRRMFHEFINAHCADDTWLQSNLSGDVELHHTTPATRGDRPFLFHCESFLPVFFPFFQQGARPETAKVSAIRAFYRDLFECRECLGIISHLPETLDQISSFFESSIIDSKLASLPVGLDSACIADGVRKSDETTNFVFVGSAQQNMMAFALRGGVSSLRLAIELLRERSDLTFYFRVRRPADAELVSYGIDIDALKRFETDRIVWIEHYLPDHMLYALIARCHFMLLPSANLHSASIMSALANGTVPIVTDTIGTDAYVEDMVNGVVIPGIRSEIWAKDEALRITYDQHMRFLKMEKAMTASLVANVRPLLAAPEKIRDMAGAGRRTMRQRFDGAVFANRLIEEVRSRGERIPGKTAQRRQPRCAEGERWIEDLSPAHFEAPNQPIERVKLPDASIYQLGRHFVLIPSAKPHELSRVSDCWSFVRMANDEFNPMLKPHVRLACASSLSECIQLARSRDAPGAVPPWISGRSSAPDSFKERVRFLLHPYRTPFVLARKTYHTLRRIGIMR